MSEPATTVVAIADRVLETARVDPDRVALIHAHHRPLIGPKYVSHTYRELSSRAESLAVGLRQIGVREGTLCSFMVPPCFDSLVLGVALWRVGAVTVGIEPHSHGLRRVARCLDAVGPEVFFGTPRAHAGRLAFGWGRRTIRTNVMVGRVAPPGMRTLESLIGAREGEEPAIDDPTWEPRQADVAPEDPTVIAFTTGSTGDPKPTVLRHRNFSSLISLVSGAWGLDGSDVVDMPTFPMFWIIGLSVGGTVVVPPMDFTLRGPGDANPARLLRTIRDCGVSSMFASPALLKNLSDHASGEGIKIPNLRRIVAGGAEVQGPLFENVKAVLEPGAEMYSDYGATEALPVAEITGEVVLGETWERTVRGAGVCAGTPLDGVDVHIVGVDDRHCEDGAVLDWSHAEVLERGTVGEIVARSPHISEDYYRLPGATARNKIADAGSPWHRMGDLGYLDQQGRLWLCGRSSHRVVTPGGTLYPLCCEPVFNAHPSVERSALVGVSYGSRTVATVCVERRRDKPVPAVELETDLVEIAEAHEATRLIEKFVFLDRLPVDRRHNAKIDRPALAEALGRAWVANGSTRSAEPETAGFIRDMLK